MVWFYRKSSISRSTYNLSLSIPLWSDFIGTKPVDYNHYIYFFQSHYGLILSGGKKEER